VKGSFLQGFFVAVVFALTNATGEFCLVSNFSAPRELCTWSGTGELCVNSAIDQHFIPRGKVKKPLS